MEACVKSESLMEHEEVTPQDLTGLWIANDWKGQINRANRHRPSVIDSSPSLQDYAVGTSQV
jgi:hypothetical protein